MFSCVKRSLQITWVLKAQFWGLCLKVLGSWCISDHIPGAVNQWGLRSHLAASVSAHSVRKAMQVLGVSSHVGNQINTSQTTWFAKNSHKRC